MDYKKYYVSIALLTALGCIYFLYGSSEPSPAEGSTNIEGVQHPSNIDRQPEYSQSFSQASEPAIQGEPKKEHVRFLDATAFSSPQALNTLFLADNGAVKRKSLLFFFSMKILMR